MSFWHTLTDLFLPRYCAVCDVELYATEHVLCNVCLSRMPQVSWRDVEDNPLLRCLWNRYDVEAAGSSLYYNTSSDYHNLFMHLKYRGRPHVGEHLAQYAFPQWHALGLGRGAEFIIPVPLARQRQWHRGYNQAEWIAKGVSKVTGIPVCSSVLRRVLNNPTQTRRTAVQRMENVSGVFAVDAKSTDLNGKIVLLVDDIFTTGATIGDCVRALRQKFPLIRIHIYTLGWAGER